MKAKTAPIIDPITGLYVLRGTITSDGSQIKVYCPHCQQHHLHGWPTRTTDPGHLEHRQAHCIDTLHGKAIDSPFWSRGYMIGIEAPAIATPTPQITEAQRRASVAGALRVLAEIDELIAEVKQEAPTESAPDWLRHYIGTRRAQILTTEGRHQHPAASRR